MVFKFKPDTEGESFLNQARKVIETAGLNLTTDVFTVSLQTISCRQIPITQVNELLVKRLFTTAILPGIATMGSRNKKKIHFK